MEQASAIVFFAVLGFLLSWSVRALRRLLLQHGRPHG